LVAAEDISRVTGKCQHALGVRRHSGVQRRCAEQVDETQRAADGDCDAPAAISALHQRQVRHCSSGVTTTTSSGSRRIRRRRRSRSRRGGHDHR
jgi:hypothetical protein